MKNYQLVAIFLLSCALTSCKTTAILTDTFESDVVGNLPIKDIPGAPSGDEVVFETVLNPRLKITTSNNSAGQKALTFSQAPATGLTAHNQFLSFRGISTDFTKPLWFSFVGTLSGSGSDLMIDIADGSAGLIARMYFRNNGDVELERSLAGTPAELIGNIPLGTIHTVVFTLDMNKKTYNLTIFKSVGNILVKDHPLLLENPLAYANPAHPQISFRFDASTFETRKYVIESVNISRKQP
ncbi:hypothetical protein ACFP1I_17590 [Dyadobacter subterraneus]|uniref:Uncharacterized protein n=1 Tax=Dyadobacter subterraneus TaxID=2773304 RepID=A0ABR9WH55_9BACT|nr:hypothetical protein [Dyadobacter subterraneus]MBE9464828.1 hypothetical protein [Dyadobacter subterraneus]